MAAQRRIFGDLYSSRIIVGATIFGPIYRLGFLFVVSSPSLFVSELLLTSVTG